MSGLIFADASFYAAIINERDELHARAQLAAHRLVGPLVTTEFVLLEVANFCSRGKQRSVFGRLVTNLRSAAAVEIVSASAELFQQGLTLFASRGDKEWSLTDCTSFVVMQERQITEALTADHHFEQAGFAALLLKD